MIEAMGEPDTAGLEGGVGEGARRMWTRGLSGG